MVGRKRSDENAAVLVEFYEEGHAAPFGRIVDGLPDQMARYAYAGAGKCGIYSQTQGMADVEIWTRLGLAVRRKRRCETLRDDYGNLIQATAKYLGVKITRDKRRWKGQH
jgi:hypothetical protein